MSVALAGPPNTGKSTLFNILTGLRQKTGNYHGVTVERHTGQWRRPNGQELVLLDLPGIYSLAPASDDERVTHDVLTGAMAGEAAPAAILLILDATNLARQLSLAAPLLRLGKPMLLVLNMADDLRARGGALDAKLLAAQVGVPVALISAARREGIAEVEKFLEEVASGQRGTRQATTPGVELPVLNNVPQARLWAGRVSKGAAYLAPAPPEWTRRIDRVLLHPVWGLLVFLAVLLLVFQSVFTVAQPLMDGLEALILRSGEWMNTMLPASWWRDLLIEGVWGGVGSVLVFLPQILILFTFIVVLEDTGYMARAALMADRALRRIGLQGKSFIPLLSGWACAIPAILSTRTIENPRDRLATILVTPLMTCSARLPVYTLLIAAFIPDRPLLGPLLGQRAAVLFGLYALGLLAVVFTARILKSTILKSDQVPFMLELPPYRWPDPLSLVLRLIDRAMMFLKRAFTLILGTAVVLWVLSHLPLQNGVAPSIEQSYAGQIGRAMEPLIQPLGWNWKVGVGILSSLAAREVVVGTLGTLYGIEAAEEDTANPGLQAALRQEMDLGAAIAMLIFFTFALQCMSTVAVVRRETGGWKWPLVQFVYLGLLAYGAGLLVSQAIRHM
jgi:ferrous iron transport protein B